MKEEIITIKVDENKYVEIKNFYFSFIRENNPSLYVDYIADKDNLIITGYLSKKSRKSVSFKGKDALKEAQKWDENASIKVEKEDLPTSWIDIEEQIGSDEVGVGDYLLPMVVVASLVKPSQIKKLRELGVTDSKKLTDKRIKEIAPTLIKEFEFAKLTLPNEKYNEMISKGENINSLKAKMHNRALAILHEKYEDIYRIYVDQFVNEKKYYSYLGEADKPIVKGIGFKTKGESYFPSVAVSSVIARFSFLIEKEKLEEKYNMEFPCGANKKVDEVAHKLKEKLPKEEFDKLVKQNFKNYKQ